MTGFSQKLFNIFQKKNIPLFLYWGIIFIWFFLNTFHESYPDEFDNLSGGWYIIHGRLPYIGFFTHHGPVGYFIAAIALLFSGQSFVRFRIVYSIFLFLYTFFTTRFLLRSIGKEVKGTLLVFVGFIALSSTYFWFQMLLADTVSAFFILPTLAILLLKSLYKKQLTFSDIIFLSITSSLAVLASLTYIYLILSLYIFALILYLRQERKIMSKNILIAICIVVSPYILFGLYLLLSRSISDYIYQAITFNQKYYIYNYPRPNGVTSINPIRFAIVIAHDFFDNFFTLLVQIKDVNISYPVNITLAIANVSMVIYFLIKKKYLSSCFFILFCIYSNGRSNPLTSGETDYQSAVYIFISLFAISFLLFSLYKDISETDNRSQRLLFQLLFIPLGFYSIFLSIFFFNKFDDKYYAKYMGEAPLIYDRPQIAPIINKILSPNDYVWIGPFSFEDLFYTNERLATRYQILNPGMGESARISQGQVIDIERTKPKIIWYERNFFILGKKPADYAPLFNAMLANDYVTLYDYNDGNIKYRSVIPVTEQIDLETYLYIRKDSIHEIINRLIANNLIKKVFVK